MTRDSRRAWLARAGLVLASLTIALFAGEAATRFIVPVGMAEVEWATVRLSEHPTLMYELKPDVADHNQFGFRGPNRARDKPDGTFRVAMLGDSLTYGLELEGSETIPSRLEILLDRPSAPAEVLNFGVPGYSIIQEAAQARLEVVSFDPDLAVLLVCLNDWDADTFEFQALLGTQSESRMRFLSLFYHPTNSRLRRLLYRSHLVRLTTYQMRRGVTGPGPAEWGRYQRFPNGLRIAASPSVLQHYVDSSFYPTHFRRLADVLAGQAIPLVVVLAPWNLEGGNELHAARLAELKPLCTGALCTTVDFLAAVRDDSEIAFWPEEVYSEDQVHLTNRGATAIARLLAPHVEQFRQQPPAED